MATPSLKRLSPETMSWNLLMTPICLNVDITLTGSVGARTTPMIRDSNQLRPRAALATRLRDMVMSMVPAMA